MKHSLFFAFVAALVWTTFLFAYSDGPLPASNGIFGGASCNQSGCHAGNAVNTPGGSLTLTGLPAAWTPGQTYLLTVTVQRANAAKYGFQLSAVSDATDTQAGFFSVPAGQSRVSIVGCFVGTILQIVTCTTPGSIQYAHHNITATSVAPYTGVFTVNWTAPATVSGGVVRFNLAGNAANGNGQNTGDFIYERSDLLSQGSASKSSMPFSLTNLQSTSAVANGSGTTPTIGYARVQSNPGSTTPPGLAVFALRQNNVLVSEAGVQASPLLKSGRLYVDVSGVQGSAGATNTGVAIANPNGQPARLNFFFTDSAGIEHSRSPITIPPNSQVSGFVDQAPFNSGANIRGTLTFISDVPIAVTALRGYYNERAGGSEFLMTTMPVADTLAPAISAPVVIPHFADGGGWSTQMILINPTDNVLTGSAQLLGPGNPTSAASLIGPTLNYVVPKRGSFSIRTAGTALTTTAGSVKIVPSDQTDSPIAMSIFTFKSLGVTTAEAAAVGVSGNFFRVYAESSGSGNAPGTVQTGIAIANLGATPATVFFDLYKLDGTPVGLPMEKVDLGPNGQSAEFLSELFPSLQLPFQGIARISTTAAAGISVVGLRGRYNERAGDFLITTLPASNEANPATNAEWFFPHLVSGGGYSTQFILFSGAGGQSSDGNLRFYSQDGSPLGLILNP